MLEIGAQAFGFERAPQGILVHGVALLRPLGEHGGVDGELGLHALDGGGVVVEEDLWAAGTVSVNVMRSFASVIGQGNGAER